jgi:hypothetical protein
VYILDPMNPMNPGGPPGGYPQGTPGHPQQQGQVPAGYGPPPQGQGYSPAGYPSQQQQPYPQQQQAYPQQHQPQQQAGGYAQAPQPGMPQGMMGIPGLSPAGNRYGGAQQSLAGATSSLKMMQIGFAAGGALLALLGVVLIFVSGFVTGLSMIITGVVLAGTAWFMLPQFMGQLGAATATVDALHAKEQVAMNGVPMTARLLSMQQTGALINFNPQIQAMLEVHGPQGPYQVQTMAVVPQMSIPQFQPGAMVNVRVNPQNPHDVAVVF